jgi:hypothetical protein
MPGDLDGASLDGATLDGGRRDAGSRDGGARDAGTVDAGPEPCEDEGATEEVACGLCGTTTRFCTVERIWVYGLCDGEGECTPGEERSGTCQTCGTQLERCSDACAWEPIGECDQECSPGTRSRSPVGCPSGQTREVVCSDACAYEPAGACEDDTCPSPGAIEQIPCGNCGTQERFCTSLGVWSYGTCGGERECAPGTVDMLACGNCGEQQARCLTDCTWQVSGDCESEGECEPGNSMRDFAGCPDGESRELTCNASCAYDAGACESSECVPGSSETVDCGRCGRRLRTCDASGLWVDGLCMNEGACVPGMTGTQSCGLCGNQPVLCDDTCEWMPTATCGGEGSCVPGIRTSCTTTCGSTGSQTCTSTCTSGACIPPSETCNGRDDDCDGTNDEGCTGCTACPGSTTVSPPGGRYNVALTPNVRSSSTCGGSGSEALLTLTLTLTSDVFISTHGAPIDTVVYARRCNCDGSEIACNDDADGQATSALRLTSLSPGTYAIVVDSKTVSTATVPVDVYVSPATTQGDRCGNPLPIAPGTTRLTGTTCGRSANYDLVDGGACANGAAADGEDAVYYFYVPTARTVTFNGCRTGNTYDGTLYIRSVCSGFTTAHQIACNDDNCSSGTATCDTYRPNLSTTLQPGLYYLFVDGYVHGGTPPTCAQCGTFDLAVSGL